MLSSLAIMLWSCKLCGKLHITEKCKYEKYGLSLDIDENENSLFNGCDRRVVSSYEFDNQSNWEDIFCHIKVRYICECTKCNLTTPFLDIIKQPISTKFKEDFQSSSHFYETNETIHHEEVCTLFYLTAKVVKMVFHNVTMEIPPSECINHENYGIFSRYCPHCHLSPRKKRKISVDPIYYDVTFSKNQGDHELLPLYIEQWKQLPKNIKNYFIASKLINCDYGATKCYISQLMIVFISNHDPTYYQEVNSILKKVLQLTQCEKLEETLEYDLEKPISEYAKGYSFLSSNFIQHKFMYNGSNGCISRYKDCEELFKDMLREDYEMDDEEMVQFYYDNPELLPKDA